MKNLCVKKVSVIVPVYNCEQYIGGCIESILCQTYANIELILVNDGSTDNSYEVCKNYARTDSRIRLISQDNLGVSSARNAGIDAAQGDYITFVDSDDGFIPDAIETAVAYLEDNKADVVTYGWTRIDEETKNETVVSENFEVCSDIENVIRRILEHYSAVGGGYPWNKLWDRSCFDNMELQKFDEKLFYFEDLEWVVRMMLCIKRIVICPEPLYKYLVRSTSVTHSSNSSEKKELGYHRAVWQTIKDLESMSNTQVWFKNKYLPEAVNGVVHAKNHNWKSLEAELRAYMKENKKLIMTEKSVPVKTKIRCLVLSLFK